MKIGNTNSAVNSEPVISDVQPLQKSYIEKTLEEFDEKFGKADSEKYCDSIGRKAGCDDCYTSNLIREENRDFLRSSLISMAKEMIEGIDIMKEEGRVGQGWTQDGMKMIERFEELKSIIKTIAGIE